MPRCWHKQGDRYDRNWYINDNPPLRIEQASDALDALVGRLKELGVELSLDGKRLETDRASFLLLKKPGG
jgi:hypothetical protein